MIEAFTSPQGRQRSELVLLCWYDVAAGQSRALNEIDRYVALFNLCGNLVPASIAIAVAAVITDRPALAIIVIVLASVFLRLWQTYETAFVRSILRLWYVQIGRAARPEPERPNPEGAIPT